MTKAQIYFSNDLSYLVEMLKRQLLPNGSGPFEKRLVIVPNMALKDFIMQSFAKDPEIQVAAGMHVTTMNQAYRLLTGIYLPSKIEVSLLLQYELLGIIEEVEELRRYFGASPKEERIGPFCDALATYFLRYKTYGKPILPQWQETLYTKLPWVFPSEYRGGVKRWNVHLFGFSFLPQSLFTFFERLGSLLYLVSPCAIFWGDFYSERELVALGKGVSEKQLNFFSQTFEDQNPLLANWGKVGRQFQKIVEDTPSEEIYCEFGEINALSTLKQSFLEGVCLKPRVDESIQICSTPSRLREVEVLKEYLMGLFASGKIEPKDVQVFAKDLDVYAPFIEAVFADFDHRSVVVDQLEQAFDQLVDLPKQRFSKEKVLKLLPHLIEDFDGVNVKRWIDAAEITWGFSEDQRRMIYLRDLEEGDLFSVTPQGTWLDGFRRLILGLGQFDKEACCAISPREIETFDRFYTLLVDLADDLAPLFDGTKWTIPTWLRYLACLMESYLPIDPSYEHYKELLHLASKTDHLDKRELSFEEIERVLRDKRSKTKSPPHLQSIHFGSLSDGCIIPSKVIAFLGMEEDAFPRREESASLYFGERDYRPKQADLDRYLFLQGILFAKERFYVSFTGDEEEKRGPCSLIEELLSQIEGGYIEHHPHSAVDSRYFGGDLISFDRAAFAMAEVRRSPAEPKAPLIPSFYAPVVLKPNRGGATTLKHLVKFARHPLRFYLHEILGIYPDFGKIESKDLLLSPLKRYELIHKALKGEEIERHIPVGLFGPLTRSQMMEEISLWKEAAGGLPLSQEAIQLSVGPYSLRGTLDNLTENGWLLRGKDTLEDRVRLFPQLLLAKELNIPVILIGDQSRPCVDGSLETYLDYFYKGREHPSPMVPSLAKALLHGSTLLLEQELKKVDDETWTYVSLRDPRPSAEILLKNWSSELQLVFGGIDANF